MSDQALVRNVAHWTSVASLWISLILGVVEAIIGIRFILKLAGAAEGNDFVDFVYDLSGPLVQPFQGIFDRETVGDDGIFEPESLIAMIVYALAALLLIAVLRTVVASAPHRTTDVWRSAGRDLYVRLSALHDSLLAYVGSPAGMSGADYDEAESQIEASSSRLHSLELEPPNERAGLAVRDLLVSLNDVRAALPGAVAARAGVTADGQPAPAQPSAGGRAALRDRLADLDGALQRFREIL